MPTSPPPYWMAGILFQMNKKKERLREKTLFTKSA